MVSARVSSQRARFDEPGTARWLRLVRGSAREPDRMLSGLARSAALSVGSDVSCDWQIDGADVPAIALWMRALPGSLFVRAAGGCPVSVDGHPLGSMWTPVSPGSRVSVGGAAFEVGLSGRSRTAQSERLQRVCERIPDGFGAPQASCSEGAPAPDAPRLGGDDPWRLEAEDPELPTATIFDANDVSTEERPSARPRARWTATLRIAASVGIGGGLLACAYRCWVLLLDRL